MRYKDVTAHVLIAELCQNMAEEVAEHLYSMNNDIWKTNRDRKDFVAQIGPTLKAEAKTILGAMLNDPDLSQRQKDEIYEALILDNELPKTGTSIVHKTMH